MGRAFCWLCNSVRVSRHAIVRRPNNKMTPIQMERGNNWDVSAINFYLQADGSAAAPVRPLLKARRGHGRRFGPEPFVIVRLSVHCDEAASHRRMPGAAQLGTINLITTDLRRRKPDRNAQTGNGVLANAHGNNFKRMDDILGTDINNYWFADRDMHLIEQLDIVLAVRVGGINAEDVGGADEPHVLPAKDAVRPRVAKVPSILLGDELDHRGLVRRRKLVHGLGP